MMHIPAIRFKFQQAFKMCQRTFSIRCRRSLSPAVADPSSNKGIRIARMVTTILYEPCARFGCELADQAVDEPNLTLRTAASRAMGTRNGEQET